ncbi:DNA recombination protein RecN [Sulfurovum riftiae]|uniref:DNA repair protein RecN n=1 Tax=Sulfurovum riftiae TaxID=1630136 RepID=A0A151CF67_9BACT|nr:DNA recombination protein RecN [Sulfurovum riftiae]KYJ85903.1 DNA recombination protein RecN [Sulfurovum riftiae]
MVERLYLRDLVTFKTLELEFEPGLVVFTGPSGAGKSVLMSAILSGFGHATQGAAALCEVTLSKPSKLKNEAYLLEDELCIKTLKKEKLRYFIDGQNISKKVLGELFSPYVRYLSVRDKGGFDSETLLELIDSTLSAKNKAYKKLRKEYSKRYGNYREKLQELAKIKEDEAKLAELIEFTTYEIEKIEGIDPKPGEEEELLRIKQQLSRIDKIKEALASASQIFNLESSVEEVYRLLEKENDIFSEAMNQLRADFEDTQLLADELEEIDVEEVLDRLSELTSLKNRYGSIEEALSYKEAKKKELAGYENIERDKSMLEQFLMLEQTELGILAGKISQARRKEAVEIESRLEGYLESLKLPKMQFEFSTVGLNEWGMDSVGVMLGSSRTATLSGGEFNRLRLALMAVSIDESREKQGVLILDEIDANVSGDESIAIATMIAKLSSVYQIFAISHQPHLSAKADQHIVITKAGDESRAEVLDDTGRIAEIARIIGGEKPTAQAVAFAQKLRDTAL